MNDPTGWMARGDLPPGFPTPGHPSHVVMDLAHVTAWWWSAATVSLYAESTQGGKAYLAFHMEPARFGATDPDPQFNQVWDLPGDAVLLWREDAR